MKLEKRSGRKQRQGSVLIVTLVCLSFLVTVLFGVLRMSLQHRRQLAAEHGQLQCRWLLDAGVRLALKRVASDPDFTGQTLAISDGLSTGQRGVIAISVVDDTGSEKGSGAKRISVVASLTQSGDQPIARRSHSFTTTQPSTQ